MGSELVLLNSVSILIPVGLCPPAAGPNYALG